MTNIAKKIENHLENNDYDEAAKELTKFIGDISNHIHVMDWVKYYAHNGVWPEDAQRLFRSMGANKQGFKYCQTSASNTYAKFCGRVSYLLNETDGNEIDDFVKEEFPSYSEFARKRWIDHYMWNYKFPAEVKTLMLAHFRDKEGPP